MDIKTQKLPKLRKNSDIPAYHCHYCGKHFSKEGNFLNHKCRDMKREEILFSIDGEIAWRYYTTWMSLKRKPVSTKKSFIKSSFFNAFIKFRTFVKTVELPDVDRFIKIMVADAIPPALWPSNKVYGAYLNHLDRNLPPLKAIKLSIETLDNKAYDLGCSPEEVFENAHPFEILSFLRRRQLSPWLLIFSPKFKKMVENCSYEQQKLLKSFIEPSIWQQRINTLTPQKRNRIKNIVEELNL